MSYNVSKERLVNRLLELEKEKKRRDQLPHLYSQKFYRWSREFFESRNKMTLLVASNQIGKSTIQIRKCIHWCTDTDLWEELWKTPPRQIWYLYPSLNVATAEFETKWVTDWLPKGKMKDDPQYGWEAKYKSGNIQYVQFKSGVRLYFHAYSKGSTVLQTATVHAMFTDEELPESLYQELRFRLAATEGYFSMVFTATLGQDLWYRAMEKIGKKDEAFPQAKKIHATAFDCLVYEDGSEDTPWSMSKIKEMMASCSTEAEVQKRVYGRFAVDEGLVLPNFKKSENLVKPYPIPKDWLIYSGVDIGGGGKSHKAAIVFVAVKPDFTRAAMFRGWKGDNKTITTAHDILIKYRELRGGLKPVRQAYDYGSKDFYTYASRLQETFVQAEKDQNAGRDTINMLFKLKMLDVFDTDELSPFVFEATTLTVDKTIGANKRKANDDMYDALRYAIVGIPFDYSKATYLYEEDKETYGLFRDNTVKPVDLRSKFVGGADMLRREGKLEEDFEIFVDDIEREMLEYNNLLQGDF